MSEPISFYSSCSSLWEIKNRDLVGLSLFLLLMALRPVDITVRLSVGYLVQRNNHFGTIIRLFIGYFRFERFALQPVLYSLKSCCGVAPDTES